MRWGQLKIYILFFHELLQLTTHFIIQSLQFWAKSSLGEVFENSLVRSAHFRSRSAFHWFGQDAVGVIVIDDHYVLVARNRRYQETAGLIREDLARYVMTISKDIVGALLVLSRVEILLGFVHPRERFWRSHRPFGLGRPDVLALLV